MLLEPECHKRKCKHYIGIKWLEPDNEGSEVNYCEAFPDGIPPEIAYGDNKHLKPLKGQKNDIVYEEKK